MNVKYFYRIVNGEFKGFYDQKTVEEYDITDVYEISKEDRDKILNDVNMLGYNIVVNGTDIGTHEHIPTQDELDKLAFDESVRFYNSELDFASKATAELACEIITPEMYNDVKVYMQAIDPYAQPSAVVMASRIKRPSTFDRYN